MADTALITMCKAPQAGKTKTRMCPPLTLQEASDLYSALLADTLTLLESIPQVDPIAAITPIDGINYFKALNRPRLQLQPVDGPDIGVCLHTALSTALSNGYTIAIAINSDGPHLPAEYIQQTVDLLNDGVDLVFGPNPDGGYYLIGIKQAQSRLLCNADPVFPDIQWSTDQVLSQTMHRANALNLSIQQLPANYDIDQYSDIVRLATELDNNKKLKCAHTRRWLKTARVLHPISTNPSKYA